MSQPKPKQIVARSYSGEGHGITYANQEKISLDLRNLRFESELKQHGYPDDLATAINGLIQVRADMIENRYEQVTRYIHIQQFGSFWQDFGCRSLDEWLAKFDLPTGSTLANREIMVRLFSKETFLLVGDEILGEMIYLVSRFQADPERKKADYQNIFELYCKTNDSFDKTEFRQLVNLYVNRTYAQKVAKIEDEKARPPRQLPKGVQEFKVARPVAEIVIDEPESKERIADKGSPAMPESQMDFVIEQRLCPGCRSRDAYIAQLQRIITEGLGAARVPDRPRDI